MSFGKYFTTTVVGILLLVSIVRLSLFDDGGPTHSFMQVGNEPATIYLPGPSTRNLRTENASRRGRADSRALVRSAGNECARAAHREQRIGCSGYRFTRAWRKCHHVRR